MENRYETYEKVLQHGVDQAPSIEAALDPVLERGIDSVYLVGCGGSLAVMLPLEKLLHDHSAIPCYALNSNEFLQEKPKGFSKNSLVVLSSYTGTTKETVEAARFAKEAGAFTMAFAGNADTPLGHSVDVVFANDAPIGVTDSKAIMLYHIVLYVLEKRGELEDYKGWKESLAALPKALRTIRENEARSKEFVDFIQEGPMIMVTGSGVNYGEAYMFAMCILQEMQWIPAQWIHAGEFFHGAFEILVEDTPLLVLHGEDKTRPLSQRVVDFASGITKRLFVIDSKDYVMEGVKPEHRGLLNPFVFMSVLGRLGDDLADARNHPLSTRRYMGKVKY